MTNLVAVADPALTHSEVFIAGTEPFAPVQGAPAGIALGPLIHPDVALGGMGSLLQADTIVLTTSAQGHKVYINTGALFSPGPSQASSPPSSTPLSAP